MRQQGENGLLHLQTQAFRSPAVAESRASRQPEEGAGASQKWNSRAFSGEMVTVVVDQHSRDKRLEEEPSAPLRS